jgi:hypothetical protein
MHEVVEMLAVPHGRRLELLDALTKRLSQMVRDQDRALDMPGSQ